MADFCAYFKENTCRSCSLMEMDYDRQIGQKEQSLKSAIGSTVHLLPTVRSTETGFRNKAKIIVSGTAENPILGLLEKEILDCPVHDPSINQLVHDLIPFIKHVKLVPYSVKEKKGELKGIIIFHGDETYVRFILRSKESIDRVKKHLPDFLNTHKDVSSVSINIQPIHQAILEGDEEIFLTEKTSIKHNYAKFSMNLRPQGFVQTNQKVAALLYETAAAWVKETGIQNFIELFSGQGAFSFHCAPHVKNAMGVEINREAVAMAVENAKALGLPHLHFIALDAGKAGEILQSKNPQLILVNPPRRGLAETSELLLKANPEWIIYSSCSVESLGPDLEKLKSRYTLERTQIFDMFPHTAHFETLVLLKRS